ncbi:MAG: ribosome biogenesis factor YjgA [Woeseiaceae bacterium]|nr:ribosome biogenesis factor YjgA [Woeseiaceae bacterium]
MTDAKPSKSARKREQTELQALGEQLTELPDDLLDSLDLDERLREAIADLNRMRAREAQRRQRQYIGKLMRDVDPEPIRALLDRLRADDRRQKRVFANAERWRDRIVANGHETLPAFEAEIGAASPELAELIRELDRAVSDKDERTIRRRIFRAIHDALAAHRTDG